MKSVAQCLILLFVTMFCMHCSKLSAMERIGKDPFAATKIVLRMLYNDTQEGLHHKLVVLKEKFPHITQRQLVAGLVTICLAIGVEEFMRMFFMSNGDWFMFLSMTNVQNLIIDVTNHT